MDMEALARMIAEKVLAELGNPTQAQSPILSQQQKQKQVLVFAEKDLATEQQLQQLLGTENSFTFYDKTLNTQNFSRFVVPYLCCPNMAALANGQTTSSMTRTILNLLLAGKRVDVVEFEYERYTDSAPEALYTLYADYARRLESYGLVKLCLCQGTTKRFRESLVTENIVNALKVQGYTGMIVPANAIVTDLANETAQENDFTITRASKEG